jgi:hypothetical protein
VLKKVDTNQWEGNKTMKPIFTIAVFLLCSLLLPSISSAEDTAPPLKMEELAIKILPEFAFHPDDKKKAHPPLLIGYQGTLVNQLDQAVEGKIEIPLPVNDPNFRIGYAADYSSDLKTAHELNYELDKQKGTISWKTTEKIEPQQRYKFIIECYTDSLNSHKTKRSLSYKFTSFADMDLLTIDVTKPYKAGKMELSPAPAQNSHNEDGESAVYFFQNVKKGEEKSFTLSYERSEVKPTMELLTEKAAKSKKPETHHYAAIGSVSGLGLALAGVLFFRRKKFRG